MKIGFIIMLAELRNLNRAPAYSEIREMAQRVEALSFDSLWLYDHLLYRPEGRGTVGIWECWSMLAALAADTQRVELGTLVVCNSFRNPALLAKMAATVDEISGGRLILGLGAGWNEPEYDAFGFPFDHKVDRFEEALQIIRPLLREGRVDFAGTYYSARNCEIVPRGPRAEGPPILVGAFGPRMLRLTAQYADMWNTAYLHRPSLLDEPRADFEAACYAVGRDPADIQITAAVALGFPDLAGGDLSDFMEHLTGTPAEIAAALWEFEQRGVAHLQFHVAPYTREALERLGEAVALYREGVSS